MKTMVPLLQVLLLVAFLLGLMIHVWRKRARLRALVGRNGQSVPVFYHPQENLLRSMLTPQHGFSGMLLLEPGKWRFAQESSGRANAISFVPVDCELALIDSSNFLGITPALIRLSTAERSYYFQAQGWGMRPDNKATRALHQLLQRQLPSNRSQRSVQLPLPRWVAAVALFPLLMGIGLIGFSLLNRISDIGPSLIATQTDNQVLAATDTELLRFDAEGNLQDRKSLSEFGLAAVSDLQFAGAEDFWVGDWDRGEITRCNWAKTSCTALPKPANDDGFRRAFKFLPAADHGYFYATDTARHRLLVLNERGELVASSSGQLPLCFPNGLILARDGKLYIADTNHHRIVRLPLVDGLPQFVAAEFIAMASEPLPDASCTASDSTDKGNAIWSLAEDFSEDKPAKALTAARRGSVWPTAVLEDADGNWWVLLGNNNLRYGDVLRFSPAWTEPKRVSAIGDDNDVSTLSLWGDFVLATDTDSGQPLRIDRKTLISKPYGGETYQAYVDAARDQQQRYEDLRFVGIAVLFLPMLLLIVILHYFSQKNMRVIREADPHLRKLMLG